MFREKPCICIPLLSNANKHASESSVIGMYFYFIDNTDRYINFTHPDELYSDIFLLEQAASLLASQGSDILLSKIFASLI